MLLDSGYECADELPDTLDIVEEEEIGQDEEERSQIIEDVDNQSNHPAKDEETSSVASSSEASSSQQSHSTAPSVSSEETEALRKHIEDCFQMTDTISEQTRRICGKDYHQFRASQLQKLRYGPIQIQESNSLTSAKPSQNSDASHLSMAAFPSLGDNSTTIINEPMADAIEIGSGYAMASDLLEPCEEVKMNGESMIPMTLDPSFVQQLVSLFGAPVVNGTPNPSNLPPSRFDIPWSLAEQIYLHWCSSLVSQNDKPVPTIDPESKELQDIMDFEFAMQLVQDEVHKLYYHLSNQCNLNHSC